MNVLIACEESQEVCKAFRERGHRAFSCDIQECSGGHPEWHIKGDVLPIINGRCEFTTMDGEKHTIDGKWDLLIAHPPCTYLTVSGNRWFNVERYGEKAIKRLNDRQEAYEFFMSFVAADCDKIAIENPIGYMSSHYRKPDQTIQPYQFGHHARKATCLWLKNLPKLNYTKVVDPGEILEGGYSVGASANYAIDENGKIIPWNDPRTAKARSKTFPGIARAMAEQWG
jgi:site-specific DNA-cytosine methylase